MALAYDFKLGSACAGLSATVTDAAGSAVAGSPVTLDSSGAAQLSLNEGIYQADAAGPTPDGRRHLRCVGVLNVPASIEAAMLAPAGP